MTTRLELGLGTAGLISISASPHNLGTILSANAIACRMFGYARWQLERRNVSSLVPSPLAESHDHFLKRFLATGEGNVVNYTVSRMQHHRAHGQSGFECRTYE